LTYGSLVYSEKQKLKSVLEYFSVLMRYYKDLGFDALELKELPSIYTLVPNAEMNYLMFILEAKLIRRDVLSVVNFKNTIKVSKDRIAGNKRAIKHQLVIKEMITFSEFWNEILIPNLNEKHGVQPVHSLEEIKNLKQKFPNNIRQFNVYKEDEIVAGATIFETKNVAHSQYISGNEEKNNLGSLDFLHLHLIEQVFRDKAYFDFGISNENFGKQINAGLNYWKEGFGARTVTQDFYKVDLNNIYKLDAVFV
ncbi:MAG: GNAT family N-acetyltransferase, partial [Flavobacteriaceae bacterium]|nr:GNAT family N-acetyltransferase [Flavobacteriaceae bacterium]